MARIHLAAVGDIGFFGRLAEKGQTRPVTWPFEGLRPALEEADLRFGNLEAPFEPRTGHRPEIVVRTPQRLAETLEAYHFSVLCLANNHVGDLGPEGVLTSLQLLGRHGLGTVGAGATMEEALRPLILEVKGQTIGFLAFAHGQSGVHRHIVSETQPGAAPLNEDLVEREVRELRGKVDWVVVSFHHGVNYVEIPSPAQLRASRLAVDAGADVILGHHPHILQGWERYRGKLILHSLGEIIFDPLIGKVPADYAADRRRDTIVAEVFLEKGKDPELKLVPVRVNEELLPEIVDGNEAERILGWIAWISERIHDEDYDRQFFRVAGDRMGGHALRVLWRQLRRGEWREFGRALRRIRPQHLKLLGGYLRGVLPGRSRGGDGA